MRQLRKNLWVIFNMTIVALPHLGAAEIDNWKSASGEVWKAASGECWRNVSWTPDTAAMTCDGAVAPKIAIAKPVEEKPVAPSVAAVEPVAAYLGRGRAIAQECVALSLEHPPHGLRNGVG